MIRVTVELIPYGIGKPKVIALAIITNDGSTPRGSTRGNYEYKIWGKRVTVKNYNNPLIEGRVEGFARKSKNVWHLLKLILENAL